MTETPQCFRCKHYRDEPGDTATCDAFPDGIPDPIFDNEFDHKKPYQGDNGIRFEVIPPPRPKIAESTRNI